MTHNERFKANISRRPLGNLGDASANGTALNNITQQLLEEKAKLKVCAERNREAKYSKTRKAQEREYNTALHHLGELFQALPCKLQSANLVHLDNVHRFISRHRFTVPIPPDNG